MEKVAPESSKSSPQNFQKNLNMEPPKKKKKISLEPITQCLAQVRERHRLRCRYYRHVSCSVPCMISKKSGGLVKIFAD